MLDISTSTIGKPGETDSKTRGKLAFNAVWQQCYDAVFSFVNKTGVAKALCCPDITQIHKTAYCDSKCRSPKFMPSPWSDTVTFQKSETTKQPDWAHFICKPNANGVRVFCFPFTSPAPAPSPAAVRGRARRPASKPEFAAISAAQQHQWLIVSM